MRSFPMSETNHWPLPFGGKFVSALGELMLFEVPRVPDLAMSCLPLAQRLLSRGAPDMYPPMLILIISRYGRIEEEWVWPRRSCLWPPFIVGAPIREGLRRCSLGQKIFEEYLLILSATDVMDLFIWILIDFHVSRPKWERIFPISIYISIEI